MIASAKMSRALCDCFLDVLEYGDGVCDESDENDVSRGESICIWRFARGELGSPLGESGG